MNQHTNHQPLTNTQLDEIAARAAGLYEYATGLDKAWQAEADRLTGTDVPALLAEVHHLRDELATARVQAIRDLADKADPQRPEISFFGDHGHEVGAWMRKQAEYEERVAAAAGSAGGNR